MGCNWSFCARCGETEGFIYERFDIPQPVIRNQQNSVDVTADTNRNSIDRISTTRRKRVRNATRRKRCQKSQKIKNKNGFFSQKNRRKPRYEEQSTAASDKREWILRNEILKLVREEETLKLQISIPVFKNQMSRETNATFCKKRLIQLNPANFEFKRVRYLFKNTTKGKNFQVINIKRVENLELYAMYLLKKQELLSRFGHVQERLLFHGTKSKNVNEICQNNFNWRLNGKAKGNTFGRGVSFSEIAFYSSHYCESKHTVLHTMFLVKVLQCIACIGKPLMTLPIDGCDTTYKPSKGGKKDEVVVKFEDHEFYPMYIIEFFKDNSNNEVSDEEFNNSCSIL